MAIDLERRRGRAREGDVAQDERCVLWRRDERPLGADDDAEKLRRHRADDDDVEV